LGWEALVNSLLDSGLVISASWPIHTEREARHTAREQAALASSIYIVARKAKRKETGWYNEVQEEIRRYLDQKLDQLWRQGITGADFFIAGVASAIEVFGKYEKVLDFEGSVIRADRLLDLVRVVVTDYAVKQMLEESIARELTPIARFYILYRWIFGEAQTPFDEVLKLSQSVGIDLEAEWSRGFIRKEKEFIRVLGPQNRKMDELEEPRELIDVLHKALLLWQLGDQRSLRELLDKTGFGVKEVFYRVGQAVAQTLSVNSQERKLLEGFLLGGKRIREEANSRYVQKRLVG
jgi:adenine-specific DNA methylase